MPISSAVKRTVSTSTYPLLLVIFSPPPVTDDVCVSRALAMVMSMTLSRVTLAATSRVLSSVTPPLTCRVSSSSEEPSTLRVCVAWMSPVTYSAFVVPPATAPPTASLPFVTVSPVDPSTPNSPEVPIASDPSLASTVNVRAEASPTLRSLTTPSVPFTVASLLTSRSTLTATDVLDSVITSALVLTPILASVKRTSSTSTYPLVLSIVSPVVASVAPEWVMAAAVSPRALCRPWSPRFHRWRRS